MAATSIGPHHKMGVHERHYPYHSDMFCFLKCRVYFLFGCGQREVDVWDCEDTKGWRSGTEVPNCQGPRVSS